MKSLAECRQEMNKIVLKYSDKSKIMNEAQTRFHIIDEVLSNCLNWEKNYINVEVSQDRQFSDYELGKPRSIIWEAKREGTIFEIPAGISKKQVIDIPSLILNNPTLKDAIFQVCMYCANRGVPIAVVTNGHQFIAFNALNYNGKAPLDGKALVFLSLENCYEFFDIMWNMLSFDGVKEQRLTRYLNSNSSSIPLKLSNYLYCPKKVRYPSELQSSLKQISQIIIQDYLETPKLEKEFYQNCYCESGSLSKYSLVSKNVLKARYAALFDESEKYPAVTSVKNNLKDQSLDPTIFSEAMSKRPIVLIGDVGVGKTSFVKNLMYSSEYEEFKNAIYLYIDLGSQATLTDNLNNFVLDEIIQQLKNKYVTNIYEDKFVKGVYSREIIDFSRSIWSNIKESNRSEYDLQLLKMLQENIDKKDNHLKRSISHLVSLKKQQVVICIDNADQRDFNIQQQAFIISQELAKHWNALVFISVRPQTFFRSKVSGAFAAYPDKVFTISPPRIDLVVKKRLEFALKVSEGKLPLEYVEKVNVQISSLAIFIKILLDCLQDKELCEFISNITGGNIRQALGFITAFIGSPNVESEKIIKIYEESGRYKIPLHEFTKQALLGDYSYFDDETSLAMNVYDVSLSDPKEHFIVPILLAFLSDDKCPIDNDYFCLFNKILDEIQSLGYTQSQIENALRRATNKKLIETSQRFTFDEDESGLIGDMPEKFRITTIGAYHLQRWMTNFAYIDAILFDTPIFDEAIKNELNNKLESFDIKDRYERAIKFREYLITVWNNMINKPNYFDFKEFASKEEISFNSVKNVVEKMNH